MHIGLEHYLGLAAVLFCIGFFGVLVKKNAIIILMCIEIMLNSVNIAAVAFSHFITTAAMTGQVFALFILIVAAAEVAVGLGVVIAVFRARGTISATDINSMKW